MIHEHQPDDLSDPSIGNDDVDAVTVNGFDVRNVAFVMPLGAPIPNEANAAAVPQP